MVLIIYAIQEGKTLLFGTGASYFEKNELKTFGFGHIY